MHPSKRAVGGSTACLVIVALALAPSPAVASDCETRTMRVSFYTCAEGFSHCLTRAGHQPIPFKTVAVGDRTLLGRWLYVEDLGGWVLASDTGSALKKDWLDVFIGEGRMAQHAKRLGVQFWMVRVCLPVEPATPLPVIERPPAGAAEPLQTRTASAATP